MFGINFKAWSLPAKGPRGRASIAPTQDRAAMQDCVRHQEFVDTHPAATYIEAEFWQLERPTADVSRCAPAERRGRSSAPTRALDELVV